MFNGNRSIILRLFLVFVWTKLKLYFLCGEWARNANPGDQNGQNPFKLTKIGWICIQNTRNATQMGGKWVIFVKNDQFWSFLGQVYGEIRI